MASVSSTTSTKTEQLLELGAAATDSADKSGKRSRNDRLQAEFSKIMDKIAAQISENHDYSGFMDGNAVSTAATSINSEHFATKTRHEEAQKESDNSVERSPLSSSSEQPISNKTSILNTPVSSTESDRKKSEDSSTPDGGSEKNSEDATRESAQTTSSEDSVETVSGRDENIIQPEAKTEVTTDSAQLSQAVSAEVNQTATQSTPESGETVSLDKPSQESKSEVPTDRVATGKPDSKVQEVFSDEKGPAAAAVQETAQVDPSQTIQTESSETGAISLPSKDLLSPARQTEGVDTALLAKAAQLVSGQLDKSAQGMFTNLKTGFDREIAAGSIGRTALESIVGRTSDSTNVMNQLSSSRNGDGAGFKPFDAQVRSEILKSPKALLRSHAASVLEKVESVLKEAARARDGKTISLRLDPPSLGNLKIDVSLRDSNLHARVVTETSQVSQFLREHAHELQSILRKAGLDVEKVSVSVVSSQSEGDSTDVLNARTGQNNGNGEQKENQTTAEKDSLVDVSPSAILSDEVSRAKPVLDHWVA